MRSLVAPRRLGGWLALAAGLPAAALVWLGYRAVVQWEQAATMVENDYQINAKRSLGDVKRRIKLHLTPFFGGRRLSAITKDEIQKYIVSRQNADAKNATE